MVPKFLILTLCVGYACAAVWLREFAQKPKEFEDKEGCYIEEINDVIPYGKTITPLGHCERIHCSSNGAIDYASCGLVGTEDRACYVTDTDLSKPYPSCCPDVKCDLDNNL